jgi:hypothetical protein
MHGAVVPIGYYSITASTTFFNIPQNYQDLMVVYNTRDTTAATGATLTFYLNADGANNYSYTSLNGDGSSATSARTTNQGAFVQLLHPGANATSGIFGSNIVHILNYANTSTYKTVLTRTAEDLNGSGNTRLTSGLYRSTSGITAISAHSTSGSFASGSTVSIYGIRTVGQ